MNERIIATTPLIREGSELYLEIDGKIYILHVVAIKEEEENDYDGRTEYYE